ncbi:hypothetical protein [Roseovarius sp. D0-M9]|uniref:hypothetical protein n=1 Tax=Roseovarius sp. D0-M9 TaxID=3127117 RepID=UPI00300FED05
MSDKHDTSGTAPVPDIDAALCDLRRPAVSEALMARIEGDATALSALEAARRAPPEVSDLLMARIARSAREERPRPARLAPWAALMAAGIAGLGIGLSNPAGLSDAAWPGNDRVAMNTLLPAYEFQYLEME